MAITSASGSGLPGRFLFFLFVCIWLSELIGTEAKDCCICCNGVGYMVVVLITSFLLLDEDRLASFDADVKFDILSSKNIPFISLSLSPLSLSRLLNELDSTKIPFSFSFDWIYQKD